MSSYPYLEGTEGPPYPARQSREGASGHGDTGYRGTLEALRLRGSEVERMQMQVARNEATLF